MAEKTKVSNRESQIIRGFPFPNSPWFSVKNIEDALDYTPKDGDTIIASYPKTGTTWLQYIVLQIISKGQMFPSFDELTYKVVPYMEISGIAAVEALSKPRIYKHHIPYNMVKKNERSKVIYIYRNPEDTAVSLYHFVLELLFDDTPDFNDFFESFLTEDISYGNYFKHIMSYYECREDANLLMVSYEKLHANRKDEILKIARFLGEQYYEYLLEDEDILSKIMEKTSFQYMKNNLNLIHPSEKSHDHNDEAKEKRKVNFFRKGIVGDGKEVLTDVQRQKLRAVAEKILSGSAILDEWYAA